MFIGQGQLGISESSCLLRSAIKVYSRQGRGQQVVSGGHMEDGRPLHGEKEISHNNSVCSDLRCRIYQRSGS